MSTKTPTREEAVTEHGGPRFRWLWVLALVVVVAIAGVVAWQVLGDDDSTTEGVSAETEEQITALIDAWLAAWNEGDGQAAVDLFTNDGRWVNFEYEAPGVEPLDGFSGEALKDQVERKGGLSGEAARSGDPLILVHDRSRLGRPDSYRVATKWRGEYSTNEELELYNIVDEDGTLKFRYVETWADLGWFRLAEDLPYQGSEGGE